MLEDLTYRDDKFYILRNLLRIQRAFGIGTSKAYEAYKIIKKQNHIACDANTVYLKLPKEFAKPFYDVKTEYNTRIMQICIKYGIKIMTIEDENYPEKLRQLYSPPLLLYYIGHFPDFDNIPAICVVGPRKVTEFGAKSSYSLSKRLSKAGFMIISGAAVGSDYYAHKGTLDYDGFTVGVLGCGLLYDYLPQNADLRKEIAKRGCLISEYPPFCQPGRFTFPIRNRIMAALSDGVVVTEAGEKSGAINTAHQAVDLNKDVFVIPGGIDQPQYKGSNLLLREGAIPLIEFKDIFEYYNPEFGDKINIENAYSCDDKCPKFVYPPENANFKRTSSVKTHEPYVLEENEEKKDLMEILQESFKDTLSKEAKMVYNNLNKKKFTVDDLIGLDIKDEDILSALTELEMNGFIKALPGGYYENRLRRDDNGKIGNS